MAFRVGQRVVCVDDSPSAHDPKERPLRLNEVYVITGLEMNTPIVGLYLHGVAHIGKYRNGEWMGWHARRFRPVVERKTDISTLQALLNPANHREHV